MSLYGRPQLQTAVIQRGHALLAKTARVATRDIHWKFVHRVVSNGSLWFDEAFSKRYFAWSFSLLFGTFCFSVSRKQRRTDVDLRKEFGWWIHKPCACVKKGSSLEVWSEVSYTSGGPVEEPWRRQSVPPFSRVSFFDFFYEWIIFQGLPFLVCSA